MYLPEADPKNPFVGGGRGGGNKMWQKTTNVQKIHLWEGEEAILCCTRSTSSSNETLGRFLIYIYKSPVVEHWLEREIAQWKEGNVLFNDALNTFYLRLYGVTHMVKDHSDSEREETRCRHMGYSFRLAARVILYASSLRQDNTYHGLCYTSRGALAGTRNSSWVRRPIAPWANALTTELHLAPSSVDPPWRIDPTTHRTMSEHSTTELCDMNRWFDG